MNRKISTLLLLLSLLLVLTSWRAFTGRAAGVSSVAAPTMRPLAEKPINQYTYLATHNAIVSYAYGFNLQNSQRYDVSTQLDGGARMMEIDIVYDTPEDKHTAGVYICHCGEAPHSNSKIELQRAKDNNLKSKAPLPNWSNGGKYIRFAIILKQIDQWLISNPKEIVFIMTQNNSATASQFDGEVALAGLKTGVYVKPAGQTVWPTRTELTRANTRLVFLAGDGADLSASKYANKSSFIAWKGYITPKIYGSKNEYTQTGGDDKFLVVGSFTADKTDAITARYYNDYDELNKRKAEWVTKGYTRYPTFIQVNQIQIGDALKFVNELNDSSYQVVGKVPKDSAGEWIVNASADIGSAFYSIGEYFTGETIPSGSRGIKFKNEAGYVAKMTAIYYVNQTTNGVTTSTPKVLSTDKLTAGMTRPLIIPSDIATDKPISVSIQGVGTTDDKVFSTTVSTTFTGELCFKARGTIFSPKGGKCD
jgi:hypothetical protein